MIRLLALVAKKPGVSPGQRYRLEQWARPLEREHGIHLDFAVFESARLTEILYDKGHLLEKAAWMLRDTWRRRLAVARAREYDAVVVFREAAAVGPAIYERWLARAGPPMLFDFDDAVWIPVESRANSIFARLKFNGKTSTICRIASAVTAGNNYLAEYSRQYNPNTFVVPTSIDLDAYPVQPVLTSASPIVIVWSGSMHTLVHLQHARTALQRFARMRNVRLRVIADRPPTFRFDGIETEFIRWRVEGEAQTLGAAHIGIMPLPDDPFARGKCGLKALQYMATGRPIIASPVGVNRDIVEHGKNGFLAATDDEWIAALETLASSADVRARMGAAARRTVEERYSAPVAARIFAEAVKSAISRGPTPR